MTIKTDREIFDLHTVNVISMLLAIDCLLILLTSILFSASLFWTGIVVSFIWAWIVLKTKMFDWFLVEIPPLRHYVVGSPFKQEQVVIGVNDEIQDCTWSGMLREIYPGIRGKYPQEEIIRIYNMERQLEIKNTVTAYTKGNVSIEVDYLMPVSLLAGYLVNFAGRDPKYVIDFLKGLAEGRILSRIRTLDEKDVFESAEGKKEFKKHFTFKEEFMGELKKHFTETFGGPDVIHDTEKKLGVFTGCPTITDIRRSEAFEEAAQDVEIAKNLNKAIDALTSVPPNQRAIFFAMMKGKGHMEYVDVSSFAGKGNLIYNARGAVGGGGGQKK